MSTDLILRESITCTWYVKCLKIYVRIQSCPAGPVRQIWVSGPVRSGNSYAQSGWALVAGYRQVSGVSPAATSFPDHRVFVHCIEIAHRRTYMQLLCVVVGSESLLQVWSLTAAGFLWKLTLSWGKDSRCSNSLIFFRVCVKMSCETSKIIVYICKYSP